MEDYKEKYKQALERAKNYHKGHTLDVNPQAAMEYVFPELKESEDERIRKEILQSIKNNMIVIHKDKCIAWLEKQGEQKPAEKIEPKFKVGDTIRLKGSMAEYTIESIDAECYHGKGWGLSISVEDNYELVEQKPTWSEEDEELWLSVIEYIQTYPAHRNKVDWLKSIKERIKGE